MLLQKPFMYEIIMNVRLNHKFSLPNVPTLFLGSYFLGDGVLFVSL